MRDFTLNAYTLYLEAIKSSYDTILMFSEYFLEKSRPYNYCLLRHDVDRKPFNALQVAQIEHSLNLRATYYFRSKPHTFKLNIIKAIADLGHEIGYHYESLSDLNGDKIKALEDFEFNLDKFRELVTIKTICMHGRPFKPYDNRDLWRDDDNHRLLSDKYDILGELYLDIDYTDIAYINDTGRNWYADSYNVRDKVNSQIKVKINNGDDLLQYLGNNPHSKMVFQTHPERWSKNNFEWYLNYGKDLTINLVKSIL